MKHNSPEDIPSELTENDMDLWLAGKVAPASQIWNKIMADLETNPEGFASQYLDQHTDKQLAKAGQSLDTIMRSCFVASLQNMEKDDDNDND